MNKSLFKEQATGFQNQNDPKQPRNLRCKDRLSYSVKMKWDKPISVENDIQRYEMMYKIKDEKQWYTANTSDDSNSLLVQGLRSKTEYEFKVRAIFNDGAEGPFSDICKHVVTTQSISDDVLPFAQKIKDGQPAIYKLPLEVKDKSVNHKWKTRKCIFGMRGIHATSEKTILVVGATGSGKSTLIDGMVNYLLGVNWEDKCRFTIIDLVDEEKGKKSDQSQSQTDWITCYTIHVPGTKKNYILNIIDSPGFGDTRGIQRDQATVDQIKHFFTMPPPQGIESLDAVCFVTQAHLARLTPHQTYIFDSILSIFGKDISKNIFVLITFADGTDPPVIKALEAAKVPFQQTFEFNNSALFVSNEKTENEPFGPMFWNMGKESFRVFFDELDRTETKSLQLTADVLNARKKLETTIQGLLPQMQEGLNVINTIKQEKRIIDQHKASIEANKEFEYKVEEIHQRKVDLAKCEYTTNCLTCNRTCHYPCMIPNDDKKCNCSAMNSSGYCSVCPKRCIWSHHVNNSYRFETYSKKVTKTFEDLKIKYQIARYEERQHSIYLQQVKMQFDQVCGKVFSLIKQARNCINELNQKALKQNPLDQVEYIELLIEAEKRELKYGWEKRVEMWEAFKKRAELLKGIPNQEFKPWTDEEFEVLVRGSD